MLRIHFICSTGCTKRAALDPVMCNERICIWACSSGCNFIFNSSVSFDLHDPRCFTTDIRSWAEYKATVFDNYLLCREKCLIWLVSRISVFDSDSVCLRLRLCLCFCLCSVFVYDSVSVCVSLSLSMTLSLFLFLSQPQPQPQCLPVLFPSFHIRLQDFLRLTFISRDIRSFVAMWRTYFHETLHAARDSTVTAHANPVSYPDWEQRQASLRSFLYDIISHCSLECLVLCWLLVAPTLFYYFVIGVSLVDFLAGSCGGIPAVFRVCFFRGSHWRSESGPLSPRNINQLR